MGGDIIYKVHSSPTTCYNAEGKGSRLQSSICTTASPVSPMLSRKPALVGSVYMLVLTAVLTKKLWIGDIVPLYALAAAVCSVQALSEDRFLNSSEMKEIDDSSLCRLREQLFFVVTVPAYRREDC